MRISSKGRYAVRLVVDIAKNSGENSFVSLSDASVRQNISIKYLEQIARILVKNKILVSVRGATGGYKLARPPKDITVAEILNLTKDLELAKCLSDEKHSCPRCSICETYNCFEKLNILISSYLSSVSIEKLMSDNI